ncbi:hypothetical protein [Alicyclobacillus sp.]|uniref:hypothetical protein n=1 Tax=Alicyclobacillus sp. TaxID=61169 RepID=UPI0025BE857C|nr:hypothetical protein [Alicyclobacillus sp.]MCL6517869.1 hypothetical protein [Alicyclobacillus sp.]
MVELLRRAFFRMIPFAIVATFLAVLCYGVGQQVLRQTADDLPTQMAEDAAARLAAGQNPGAVIPVQRVDMRGSLSPFVIIYDEQQHPVASSATLDGGVPSLPPGVLDAAKSGDHLVTWQPAQGVREAVAIVPYRGAQSGYVMAGRSLRTVEQHENLVLHISLAAWVCCLMVLFLYFVVAEYTPEQPRQAQRPVRERIG